MRCRSIVVAGFLASSLLAAVFAASAAEPLQAEFAIRWDVAAGGPSSAAKAAAKLGLKGNDEDRFEVRYPAVGAPPNLPPGFAAVMRERHSTNKKKFELTYKQRGQSPLPPTPSLAEWACPAGATDEKKDELDVSFHGLSDVARKYSRSCTVESTNTPPVIPPALKATPAGCKSTMTRLKFGAVSVEEWRLPGGRTIVEVSQSGQDTAADFAKFRDGFVKPLVETHKIGPLKASMTELGSACGK